MKQAILLLLILSFTAVCGNAAQTTNRKPCTFEEVNRALDESDRLKDWDAVYRFWKAYHGRCLSGPVWEGSADSIVRLLVRDWNHFVDFARLASNDEAFEEFVVNNISELASQEELSAIRKNASALCPTGQAELCKQIENEVGSVFSSLQESKSSLQESNEVTLGVLEDLPGGDEKAPNFRAVRALFQKRGNEWQSFRTDCRDLACLGKLAAEYPQQVTWTVAFDGKDLGEIFARGFSEFKYFADIGLEEITSSGPVPAVGKRSESYGRFANGKVYRPLVVISSPNFSDPEVWKPVTLSADLVTALRRQFRQKFPTVSNCTNPDENILKPWHYSDDEMSLGKAYGSRKKWFLASVRLEDYRCDGPQDDGSPFESQWFAVDPGGRIRFLGSGMWLVDAGDYDNDGKSELVFASGREGVAGYKLFYDEFRKCAVFEFAYQ